MIRLCAFADEAGADLNSQISALKRNGISLIELRNVDKKNALKFTEEEAKEYKKVLNGNGISVWSLGSPLGKSDIGEEKDIYFERVKRLSEITAILGCERIRAFSFYGAYDKREEVIERLCESVRIFKENGIVFCHENEKGIYGDTFLRVKDIYDNVPGIHTVYDPANFLQCKEKTGDTLKLIRDTDYFHVKDVIKKTGEIVPAGYGDGKIEEILKNVRRDAVFTLEPHLKLFSGYADIDESEMKNKFVFHDNNESFDFAVKAFKDLLVNTGHREVEGGYI